MHAVTDNAAQPLRFTRVLRRSLAKGAVWMLLLGTALVCASFSYNLHVGPTPDAQGAAVRGMMAKHGCWSGAAPEGVIPGHVLVTLEGDDYPTLGGQRLTTRALEQVLFGKGYVGQVHGFCP